MICQSNKIHILDEIDSTNNYANGLILPDSAEEGTVVLAYFQNSGRGQQGNSWESEPGKNLLMSLILYPNFMLAEDQFLISEVVSLGIYDFVANETDDVTIKWPNDIYIGNKKVGGILIENSIKGNKIQSSVIGIGLNLNQEIFLSDAPNPVSLKQVTGLDYDIEDVANKLRFRILEWYRNLKEFQFEEIKTNYLSYLFWSDKWGKYKTSNREFTAKVSGIGRYGQLRLLESDETVSEYLFKEVEFLI